MIPESKFIRKEYLIRLMDLPEEVKLTKNSLIRWTALALGLINPKESRSLILDILEALIYYSINNDGARVDEITERIKKAGKECSEKTVYYHLQRLKEKDIIEKNREGKYVFSGNGRLSEVFKRIYLSKVNQAFETIEEALKKIEQSY